MRRWESESTLGAFLSFSTTRFFWIHVITLQTQFRFNSLGYGHLIQLNSTLLSARARQLSTPFRFFAEYVRFNSFRFPIDELSWNRFANLNRAVQVWSVVYFRLNPAHHGDIIWMWSTPQYWGTHLLLGEQRVFFSCRPSEDSNPQPSAPQSWG